MGTTASHSACGEGVLQRDAEEAKKERKGRQAQENEDNKCVDGSKAPLSLSLFPLSLSISLLTGRVIASRDNNFHFD